MVVHVGDLNLTCPGMIQRGVVVCNVGWPDTLTTLFQVLKCVWWKFKGVCFWSPGGFEAKMTGTIRRIAMVLIQQHVF